MIYGLYLSAMGVLANSHRQDVIANNLANAQTVGFKRNLALFQERPTEAQSGGDLNSTDALLEPMGGGMLLAPTYVDQSQGQLEQTNGNLNLAIYGQGYFAVKDGNQTRLTRNGKFMLDQQGNLILADGSHHPVLDQDGNPIVIKDTPQGQIEIGSDGSMSANQQVLGKIGLFDVPNAQLVRPLSGNLNSYPDMKKVIPATAATVQAGFLENSNVDPTTELTQLIKTERQLDANAAMLRMQDTELGKCVSDVGKIS